MGPVSLTLVGGQWEFWNWVWPGEEASECRGYTLVQATENVGYSQGVEREDKEDDRENNGDERENGEERGRMREKDRGERENRLNEYKSDQVTHNEGQQGGEQKWMCGVHDNKIRKLHENIPNWRLA